MSSSAQALPRTTNLHRLSGGKNLEPITTGTPVIAAPICRFIRPATSAGEAAYYYSLSNEAPSGFEPAGSAGEAFDSAQGGTSPIYRVEKNGNYIYTSDIPDSGEIAWYGFDASAPPPAGTVPLVHYRSGAMVSAAVRGYLIDLVAVGVNGVVYYSQQVGGNWSNWPYAANGDLFPFGTMVTPVARTWESLNLFAVGTDGYVYTTWSSGAADFAPWISTGSKQFPLGAPVAGVSRQPENLDLFAVDDSGNPFTAWWAEGSGWSSWTPMNGDVTFPAGAPISAVSQNSNQLDVFAVGKDGYVYTAWWNPTQGWSGWAQVGSLILPAPTAVTAIARESGYLDLFIVGSDGRVYTAWWNSTQGWSEWAPIGELAVPVGTIVAATSRNADQLDIFVVGSDGGMHTAWWNPTEQWSSWSIIGGHTFPPGTAAAALGYENDYLNVFATDASGFVFAASWMQETQKWSGWEQVGTKTFLPETSPVNLYTTTPAIENLFGLIQDETVCYLFKPPVPVYQWVQNGPNPYYYYSTNRNAPVQSGMQFQGVAFCAFDQPVPGTIPVYSYISAQEQYLDTVDRTPDPGWTKQGTVWYAYAVDSSGAPDAAPLMEYESQVATCYSVSTPPNADFTYVGNTVFVYGPVTPPIVPIEIATAPLELAPRTRTPRPGSPAGEDVSAEIYWYGVVVGLSHSATEDVTSGLNLARDLSEKLLKVFGEDSEEAGLILTILSAFLWAASVVLKVVDQGNGVYLTIPWTSLIPPTPPLGPFGIVIPTPR